MRVYGRYQTTVDTRRTGFTLVELMIVIVLIGVLMGLLLTAIFGGTDAARNAQVVTEISNLETGMGVFKTKFGVDPPSFVVLHEDGQNWDSRTIGILRRIWPQFNFSLVRDLNGDGDAQDVIALTSSECLVFFLGGVPDPASGKPLGFSKNPANPFSRPQSADASREGPFYEFEISRLGDSDGDGFRDFRDPLPSQETPYIYISANQGKGYARNIVQNLNASIPVELLDPADPQNNPPLMQSVYMQSSNSAWNAKTFQIISPGSDGEFGPGGLYSPDNAAAQLGGNRLREKDNITNFHGGTLGQ